MDKYIDLFLFYYLKILSLFFHNYKYYFFYFLIMFNHNDNIDNIIFYVDAMNIILSLLSEILSFNKIIYQNVQLGIFGLKLYHQLYRIIYLY
jgi:hypothetical protein